MDRLTTLPPGALTDSLELERYRSIAEALPVAVYTTDADGRVTWFNAAAAALWGEEPELGTTMWRGARHAIAPDGTPLQDKDSALAAALRERRALKGDEAVIVRPDGSRVPFVPHPAPLIDGAGRLFGALNMLVDISDLKRAEEHEAQLAKLVESSDDAIVGKTPKGIVTSWNAGAERLFGYTAEEMIGRPISTIIPPDRLGEEDDILSRISRGEHVDPYETVRRRKDGTPVEISLSVSAVRDAAGNVVGASKIARDISDRKRKEERIQLLAREVNHRAKNLLAIVQATVHLSNADTAEALKESIQGRLQSIAAAHTLVVEAEGTGARLRSLIARELAGFDPERVVASGADLLLEPDVAQGIAMCLHELTTNAVKYGALSRPSGRLRADWRYENGELTFRWSESGGPQIVPPKRKGFGTTVIERIITAQLKGRSKFEWRPEGLICEIVVPYR